MVLALLLAALAVTQMQTAPVPLAGNPALPYPDRARVEGVEGAVTFVVSVDESGVVTSARVLEVPRQGVGIEDAFVSTLTQWKFQPALRDGMAVPGTYAGRVTLEATQPFHTSRMYGLTSRAAWAAADRAVMRLGWKVSRRDQRNGVLIAAPVFPAGADRQEFHLFVSPFAEPARVYVASWIERFGRREYNEPAVNETFYRAFELEAGSRGEAVPENIGRRASKALRLLPPGSDRACLQRVVDGWKPTFPAGGAPRPERISSVQPIFPGREFDRQQMGVVVVEGQLNEDGAFRPTQLRRGSVEMTPGFVVSTLGGTSLWRYRPMIIDSCPIALIMTVTVEFSLER